MKKQKVFVVYTSATHSAPLNELNKLLAEGWKVVEVHQGNGEHTHWLLVAEDQNSG